MTECSAEQLGFLGLARRIAVDDFNGGSVSSNGGAPPLHEIVARTLTIERFAAPFSAYQDPQAIEHRVKDLAGQRVFAQALGYANLNDHDCLSLDPLLALLTGKDDLSGQDRLFERKKGQALQSGHASPSAGLAEQVTN